MVDFTLTQKQTEMMEKARKFGQDHIKPLAMEIDRAVDPEQTFPLNLFEKSFEIGLQKTSIPEQYGGLGLDCLTHAVMYEELAAADIGFALSILCTTATVALILNQGTEDQRVAFTKPIVEGGLGVICAAEANTGVTGPIMDPFNFVWETSAQRNGESWVLNGQKVFCTNAGTPLTKWMVVLARSDMAQAGMSAHSAFLVWPDTLGLTVGKKYDKMGHRMAYTPSIEFKDVLVPHKQLMGEQAGFPMEPPPRISTIDNFILVGTLALGLARAIYEESLAFARQRITGGKPLIQHQMVAVKLANMFIEIEAARAMTWKAAVLSDTQPQTDSKMAIGAKVMCSNTAARVSRDGLQIFGGHGYTKNLLIEKLYRDAKAPEIYEGPNDSLRVAMGQFIEWGV